MKQVLSPAAKFYLGTIFFVALIAVIAMV